MIRLIWLLGLIVSLHQTVATAGDWSGNTSLEHRHFIKEPLSPEQHNDYSSISVEPEYRREWSDGKRVFSFTPFARIDSADDERTHEDIRELALVLAYNSYEWRLGIRKVFWGVAESWHLVDIINQTDLVEDPDEEEKLGQPMVNLALIQNWGTLDFFLLPYFRERSFPGVEGRPRTTIPVDTNQAQYESGDEEKHIDGALRWSHALGDWDMGLAYFTGTNRTPFFVPGTSNSGAPVLVPVYELIQQVSLDIQATKGSWLWKLEALRRANDNSHYQAAVAGFEYSFYGLLGSVIDLGVISEYLYDSREISNTAFQDDIMVGLRLAFNDTQSTEALVGVITDREDNTQIISLEASRRLTGNWKLELEAQSFSSHSLVNPLYDFRRDDFVRIILGYYF